MIAELHKIEAATAYGATVGTFNPGLQTVVMQNMTTGEQLGDLTSILIAILPASLDQSSIVGSVLVPRRRLFTSKVRSWHGLWGDGKRIAGAFAKVS